METVEARRKLSALQIERIKVRSEVDALDTMICERGMGSKSRLKAARKELSEIEHKIQRLTKTLSSGKLKVAAIEEKKNKSFWERLQASQHFDRT